MSIEYFFSRQKLVRMNRFRRQKLVFFNIGMLYMGFFVIFSRIQRRPSIFVILKNHSVRVKMVSKRFGNKFDYFKKYNILCQSEDTIKFCRKFARNRGIYQISRCLQFIEFFSAYINCKYTPCLN